MCSTPFGISDPFTRLLGAGIRSTICAQRLSASQIHSLSKRSVQTLCGSVCSTPFGISDPFTARPEVWGAQRKSAQRLSASQIHSQKFKFTDDAGIAVLNAFRHLRSIHLRNQHNQSKHYRVLNAFRHLRSIHLVMARKRVISFLCAQRLSASQIHSLPTENVLFSLHNFIEASRTSSSAKRLTANFLFMSDPERNK